MEQKIIIFQTAFFAFGLVCAIGVAIADSISRKAVLSLS